MSTNILDELNKMLGSEDFPPNSEWQPVELGAFVKKIMHDKRLSLRQVAQASDGGITQGYVGGIVNGHYRNLTVDKVKALAKGLGIDDEDLFTILRGKPKEAGAKPDLTYYVRILDLTKLILSDAQLFDLLRLYMELTPTGRESAIKA
ncbi:MAG TPA: helix-turn-helix transcriptional regulator, partial [Blastocatellia bacterium]